MTQEIEIEYKILLSKKEYNQLVSELPFPTNSTYQTNYYFETKQFDLKKQMSALRIREKNNKFTLTLKQPHEEGVLETNDQLTKEEFLSWLNGNPVSKPFVGKQLEKINIFETELIYYGSLQTERKAFDSDGVIYVLDKSCYNGKTDYELEIEAPTKETGSITFTNLLHQFQLSFKQPITKIERFFNTL